MNMYIFDFERKSIFSTRWSIW